MNVWKTKVVVLALVLTIKLVMHQAVQYRSAAKKKVVEKKYYWAINLTIDLNLNDVRGSYKRHG